MMIAHRFLAMGTTFEFLVAAGEAPAHVTEAAHLVHSIERRVSRFRPDSELSHLNRTRSARVGSHLLALTRLALDARAATGGRFDPTVGGAVAAAGYDRSFDAMPVDVGRIAPPIDHSHGVTLDDAGATITLDPDVHLDLGGIAKGYAAELAAEILSEAGPCLVNAGGDIATRGAPAAGAWPIGVVTPSGELTLAIHGGAVATSGRDRRTWTADGSVQHHLIDPRTNRPSQSDVVRLTVAARDAVTAETYATALFLVGGEQAALETEALGLASVIVTRDDRVLMTGMTS